MKTNPYHDLTAAQVIGFSRLIMFLRRLRVIGNVYTNVTSEVHRGMVCENGVESWNGQGQTLYRIRKIRYEPERTIMQEELLESIFGRIATRIN